MQIRRDDYGTGFIELLGDDLACALRGAGHQNGFSCKIQFHHFKTSVH